MKKNINKKTIIKKISLATLAASMTLANVMPVFAATADFSAESNNGHKYNIHQIFTGTYANGELTTLLYGSDSTGAVGKRVSADIIKDFESISSTATNQEILDVVTKYADLKDGTAFKTVDFTVEGADRMVDLPDGYYLIEDAEEPANGDSFTTYVVKVVGGTVKVTPKNEKPGFDKQVLDEDKTDVTIDPAAEENKLNGKGGYWGETADHAINESFQFRLNAKLPSGAAIDDYKTYYMAFHDTMSKEITYENFEGVYATVNGKTIVLQPSTYKVAAPASIDTPDGEQNLTIEIMDLKAALKDEGINSLQGVQIDVVYNAHLNGQAVISDSAPGKDDNQNKASLEYSNNPNWEGEGKPDDTGKTEEDTVFVFTYDSKNFKTKEDGVTALADAEFSLLDKDNNPISLVKVEDTVVGEGDDAVTYTTYRPAKNLESGATITMVSPENGKFRVVGLDAGSYVLRETKAPGDYKEAEDISVVIEATHKENENKTSASLVTLTHNEKDPAENVIINEKGSKLPQTGGLGTALLYTAGGLMAVGGSIVLATKKRIGKKQK